MCIKFVTYLLLVKVQSLAAKASFSKLDHTQKFFFSVFDLICRLNKEIPRLSDKTSSPDFQVLLKLLPCEISTTSVSQHIR